MGLSDQMAELRIRLASTNDAPRISRQRIAEIRSELGPRFDDVALVISELVSNSVRHAGNGSLLVSVRSEGTKIRLEVADNGPCFDTDHPRGDGLGLSIVDKLADSWGIEPEGMCTVWAELALTED